MAEEHKVSQKHEALAKPEEEAPKGKDEQLHARIVQAAAGTHPTSKDVEVKEVHQAGAQGLHVARVAHTPSGADQAHNYALVFDDGEKSHLLWFR